MLQTHQNAPKQIEPFQCPYCAQAVRYHAQPGTYPGYRATHEDARGQLAHHPVDGSCVR